MKKLFTLAALSLMAASAVNAQFITKALNENDESTFKWENASNFILLSVGEAEREAMEGKILADYSIDDVTRHLYVWENTYVGGDGTGMNSFGQLEDHIALTVGNVGWSGFGMIQDGGIDFSMLDDTYVLHFAMKAKPTDLTSHGFGFAQAKFTIGPTAFVDGARVHKLLGDIEHNGEWYYIDIPFSVLRQCADNNDVFPADKGGAAAYNDNHFWCLSGGVAGSELHIDNIFIYKDATIPEPVENDYVLHYGLNEEGATWNDITFVPGEGENEGKLVAENVEFAENTEFKVNYGDVWYGGATDDDYYLIHSEWFENIALDSNGKNFHINEAGTYTFVLDETEDGIKLTVTGWPEPAPAVYLIGDAPLGGWDPAAPVAMTEANGIYTYTANFEEAKDVYFVFTEGIGSWEAINGHRYGPTEGNEDVVVGEVTTTQLSANDQAAYKLAAEVGEYTFTFDLANLNFKVEKVNAGVVGDVNGDGKVDIADVNAVINMMLGKIEATEAGDVTGGGVDIADVNAVINIMLGK